MIKLTLKEVLSALGGSVRGAVPPSSVAGVSTDSRTCGPDDLFFALRGERYDGHAFVAAALARGAVGAVIAADTYARVAADLRAAGAAERIGVLIEVPDPLAALGRLGAAHRRQVAASVIAVVGSNGKTTTKAMIDHLLSGRMRGRCSPKSFNNAIGVPLTLLSAEAGDEYLVVEIGTNHPGEVAALASLVQPNMAVITSVAEEHLEGLKDLAGVATEEGSVLGQLASGGFAAVNIDTPELRAILPAFHGKLATFGESADADLRLTRVHYAAPWLHFELNGKFAYRLRGPGAHNALNAAGAITIARRFGCEHAEIAERLETFAPPPMRTELIELGPVTVVNDAYNANPGSALAAIRVLESLPARGRRVAVFGEMRELGPQAPLLHRRIGQRVVAAGFDWVLLVGSAADWLREELSGGRLFGPQVERCADVAECAARLAEGVQPGDVVLIKASRAVGLERVVEPLRARWAAQAH